MKSAVNVYAFWILASCSFMLFSVCFCNISPDNFPTHPNPGPQCSYSRVRTRELDWLGYIVCYKCLLSVNCEALCICMIFLCQKCYQQSKCAKRIQISSLNWKIPCNFKGTGENDDVLCYEFSSFLPCMQFIIMLIIVKAHQPGATATTTANDTSNRLYYFLWVCSSGESRISQRKECQP